MRFADILITVGAIFLGLILAGCRPAPAATVADVILDSSTFPDIDEEESETEPGAKKGVNPSAANTLKPASDDSTRPTKTSTPPPAEPSPSPTQTATATPTATPIPICKERLPGDDLTAVVTLTYGLSGDYGPADLVPLADELPMQVTMGYPSKIRKVALKPLVEMIAEMQDQGLHPRILSAYRSYAAQAIAWDKWNDLYPEHAHIISAPPGFSEHQLGTVVDFGSPELAGIVGEDDIEFHTYFYKTSEGIWLGENAHRFGFTLSYPVEAFETTGFFYEPWHYRYVGIELATLLHESGLSLTEYQLADQSEPCIP